MNHAPKSAFEKLESRTLLSSTINSHGALVVQGTNANDIILASVQLGDGGIKILRTTINGVRKDIDLTGVHSIEIDGLNGNDQVYIDKNTVRGILVNGGIGDDTLSGGSGNDTLIGGRGTDVLQGNDGDDYLKGYAGRDQLIGNDGNDILDGGDDNDFLTGGDGDDVLIGGNGLDQMYGQVGNDSLYGADGHRGDTLIGGDGTNAAQDDVGDILGQIDLTIV